MDPVIPITWTLLGVASLAVFAAAPLFLFSAVLVALLSICVRSLKVISSVAVWSLPFLLPLVIVHGIMNPRFSIAYRIAGVIPWRPDGFSFSMLVGSRIVLIATLATTWANVDAEELFDRCVRWHFPTALLVIIAAGASILRVLRRRIDTVFIAQQARGIPSGPGILARVRAFPTIVIPVISMTLVDGEARGQMMKSRGLGSVRMRHVGEYHLNASAIGWAFAGALALGFAVLLEVSRSK